MTSKQKAVTKSSNEKHPLLKEKIAIIEEADWVKDPGEAHWGRREDGRDETAYERKKELTDSVLKLAEGQE